MRGGGVLCGRVSGASDAQDSTVPCPLCQVRIKPFDHDHNPPALEALVRVPQPPSKGPVTHKWSVQMVSGVQRWERRPRSGVSQQRAAWMCGEQ